MEYRLILLPKDAQLLFAYWERSSWRLPRILTASQARPVLQIQRIVLQSLGLWIGVLHLMRVEFSNSACAVAELTSSDVPAFLKPVPWEDRSVADLSEQERETLRGIVSGKHGPIARPGWLAEAARWLESSIPSASIRLDDIRQYNAGGGFALLRLTTHNGRVYWLKATGEPNRREFDITCLLSKVYPWALPTIVAVRPDWNAWVMEDAGESMEDPGRFRLLELAVPTLASLQLACVGKRSELLGAGATDVSTGRLKEAFPELIEYLIRTMERQRSTRVPRLPKGRLLEIGELLRIVFDRLEALAIPDTLGLNDVNPGGILFDGSRCVLTDWAEATVGNPFLTFQHVCLLASDETERMRLRELYKQSWSELATTTQIDRAFRLAPFVAIASFLYGRGDWLGAPLSRDPFFESHARSLARHLDRAARSEELREALCA